MARRYKQWAIESVLIHAAIVFVIASPVLAQPAVRLLEVDSRSPLTDAELAQLVRKLGSESYVVRATAQSRLIEAGEAAVPHLTAAANDYDLEIRSTVPRILQLIEHNAPNRRAAEFLKAADEDRERILPGWDRFRELYRDNKDALQTYAEMHISEPDLMKVLAKDPTGVGPLFQERLIAELERLEGKATVALAQAEAITKPRQAPTTLVLSSEDTSSFAALLSVAADPRVQFEPELWVEIITLLRMHPVMKGIEADTQSQKTILYQMADRMIADAPGTLATISLHTVVNFAMEHHFPSGAIIARRLLEDREAHATYRMIAILCLGRFGDDKDMQTLQELLDDSNICSVRILNAQPAKEGAEKDSRQIEVRDVALAVLLQRSGQDLASYGLEIAKPDETSYFHPGSLCFDTPEAREQALKKWETWTKENAGWNREAAVEPATYESQ